MARVLYGRPLDLVQSGRPNRLSGYVFGGLRGLGDVERDPSGAPIIDSILQNPQDGLLDFVRQGELIAILRAAHTEASRIVSLVLARTIKDSTGNVSAQAYSAAVAQGLNSAISRLDLYKQQIDAMESDATSPFWSAAKSGVSAAFQGPTRAVTPYEALLGRIQQETVFGGKDIAGLVQAEQQPGFWADLTSRAGTLIMAAYNAGAAALDIAAKPFEFAKWVSDNAVAIVIAGVAIFFVAPAVFRGAGAYKKGGSAALFDSAADSLDAGRKSIASGAARGASYAKRAAFGALRRRRRSR